MNAFTTAAAALSSTPQQTTIPGLVNSFFSRLNATSGEFHAVGGNLYEKQKVIARISPDGTILLPNRNISNVELNDNLVGAAFSSGRAIRRLKGFDDLTNPADRLAELAAGDYDDFTAVANLFGFESAPEDYYAITRAREFQNNVKSFFTALAQEEADRVRTAEEKAREERVAKYAIAWDTGAGNHNNYDVRGAGGGDVRLRLSKTKKRYPTIETSRGHTITVRQAKKAFDFASQFWHGGKKLGYNNTIRISSGSYYNSGRSAEVTAEYVKVGCQKVLRQEAERFADVMGWARVKKGA